MDVTKGKIKNVVSGKELVFEVNPSHYEISQGFDFLIEPQLGSSAPLVAFRSGQGSTLSFSLYMDHDLGGDGSSVQETIEFLGELNHVEETTRSVPAVEFVLGSVVFRGYVQQYRLRANRLDPKGEPTSVGVDLELLSDGTYERGGN